MVELGLKYRFLIYGFKFFLLTFILEVIELGSRFVRGVL